LLDVSLAFELPSWDVPEAAASKRPFPGAGKASAAA